ncbi:MAG TPA: hypothetical protein PLN21_19200 [Gemmatales bacterium]|nr:hypothetical protein [Gemmatales bacterium]
MQNDFELLPPWTSVGKYGHNLVNELLSELHPDHQLWGCRFTPLAQSGDDVLFRAVNDKEFFAVVHLTWSSATEFGAFPTATMYESIDKWKSQMIQDNIDYECN